MGHGFSSQVLILELYRAAVRRPGSVLIAGYSQRLYETRKV